MLHLERLKGRTGTSDSTQGQVIGSIPISNKEAQQSQSRSSLTTAKSTFFFCLSSELKPTFSDFTAAIPCDEKRRKRQRYQQNGFLARKSEMLSVYTHSSYDYCDADSFIREEGSSNNELSPSSKFFKCNPIWTPILCIQKSRRFMKCCFGFLRSIQRLDLFPTIPITIFSVL